MWDLITLIHTNTHLKVDDMPTIGFEIKRKCKVCGKVFVAKTLDSHYCSPKCGKVAWKRKKDVKDRNAKLEAIARQVSDIREYISVKEAVAMFGVERYPLSSNQIRTYSCNQHGYKTHTNQTLRNGTAFSEQSGKYCRERKACS